jgi:trans-2,3-dihydro-3-hydroxyanthranilate isomerase
MRRIPFRTVDVFSSRALEGNPLAVLPDASGLTDVEMQAIAREFNLSETTFVLRRDPAIERERGVRTRIFTPSEELPFAGHPTLGTAVVLRGDRRTEEEISLELGVGRITVRFSDREGRAFGEMTQKDPTFGQVHRPEVVAQALSIPVTEIDTQWPIQTVSTGNPFAIVPFRSLETLRHWEGNWRVMSSYLRGTDAKFFYLVSRATVDSRARLHARMLFNGGEDPATGSAAGPAVAWMVRGRMVEPGTSIMIEQGLEARRPSQIYASASLVEDRVRDVRVGGFCSAIMHGEIAL